MILERMKLVGEDDDLGIDEDFDPSVVGQLSPN
jgi:hypothetical protein